MRSSGGPPTPFAPPRPGIPWQVPQPSSRIARGAGVASPTGSFLAGTSAGGAAGCSEQLERAMQANAAARALSACTSFSLPMRQPRTVVGQFLRSLARLRFLTLAESLRTVPRRDALHVFGRHLLDIESLG